MAKASAAELDWPRCTILWFMHVTLPRLVSSYLLYFFCCSNLKAPFHILQPSLPPRISATQPKKASKSRDRLFKWNAHLWSVAKWALSTCGQMGICSTLLRQFWSAALRTFNPTFFLTVLYTVFPPYEEYTARHQMASPSCGENHLT